MRKFDKESQVKPEAYRADLDKAEELLKDGKLDEAESILTEVQNKMSADNAQAAQAQNEPQQSHSEQSGGQDDDVVDADYQEVK